MNKGLHNECKGMNYLVTRKESVKALRYVCMSLIYSTSQKAKVVGSKEVRAMW